jgi:probable HAF family extracellular repeat protein
MDAVTNLRALIVGLLLVLGLLVPAGVARAAPAPRYGAIDLGTLGGPNSLPNDPGISISPSGLIAGSAETKALNPFNGIPGYCQPPSPGPCHATDAFAWRNGVMTDLGTLGGYNAGIFEFNGSGVGAGFSETGAIDPLTSFPQAHAAVSKRGRLIDLGTLGGNESWASGINNRGQVAGYASNRVRDRFAPDVTYNIGLAPYPSATQWHATLWQNGKARDLGTLGGPDSIGGLLDARGEVAGESFTNSVPNAATGVPTLDPFLWRRGHMRDLGAFGGNFGMSTWMNNHGEVVGFSALARDRAVHPFLWDGKRLIDLGTLGGQSAIAFWVNDNGTVVGGANVRPGSPVFHGFLWRHGTMLDLPPAPGDTCSQANSINARGQAVGADQQCRTGNNVNAMLWQHGQAYNLNDVIAPTPLHLDEAFFVSARGQIACLGTLPNGDQRVALVTPFHGAPTQAIARANSSRSVANRNQVPAPAIRENRDRLNTLSERILQGSRPWLP